MTSKYGLPLVCCMVLWLLAGVTLASEVDVVHGGGSHATAAGGGTSRPVGRGVQVRLQKTPRAKLVDINGASKAALKKLPGIDEAQAEKIVANRPYGSKTWLVTNDVLDRQTYERIKGLVEAKQPFKTAAQNAAVYQQRNKQVAP